MKISIACLQGLVLASLFALLSLDTVAEERVVRGKVIKVVPITESIATMQTSAKCDKAKPDINTGLSALLNWDLLSNCDAPTPTVVITGYQVTYEWDKHTYSRAMAEHPGATLPLLLTVD